MDLVLLARQLAQAGHEQEVRVAVQHLGGDPVVELHGRAPGDAGRRDAALQGLATRVGVDLHVEAQLVDKRREERDLSLERELLGHGHHRAPGWFAVGALVGDLLDQRVDVLLTLAEGVRRAVWQLAAVGGPGVVERAMATPEEALLMARHAGLHAVDATLVAAAAAALGGLADERVFAEDLGRQEAVQFEAGHVREGQLPGGQEGDTQGPDGAGVRGHDDTPPGLSGHGRGQRVGPERHALAEDALADRSTALHAVQVVLDDGVIDARHDGLGGHAGGHGLIDDLGHEDRAVLAERDAVLGVHRQTPHLGHVGDLLELAPLLGDERAGTRAAGLVHGRVADAPAVQANVLRVLPADLEDGVHLWIEVQRARRVGGDLVQNKDTLAPETGGHERARDLAPGARRAHGHHAVDALGLLQEHAGQAPGGPHRIAQGVDVALPDRVGRGRVDGHDLRSRGADVEAQDHAAGQAVRGEEHRRHAADGLHGVAQRGDLLEADGLGLGEDRVQGGQSVGRQPGGVGDRQSVGRQPGGVGDRQSVGRQPGGVGDRQLGAVLGGHQGGAQGLQVEAVLGIGRDEAHLVLGQKTLEASPHAAGARHPAHQQDVRRSQRRANQPLDVLADGVVQTRQDGRPGLALIGQVGHVRLEDHRAATGEGRRVLHVGTERAGRLDRQIEPLHQLPQEVARALGAAGVLPPDGVVAPPQLQHREAVVADGDDGHRLPVGIGVLGPAGERGLGGHPLEREHAADTPGGRGALQGVPAQLPEDLAQGGPRGLVMLDQPTAAKAEASVFGEELDDLQGLGPQIDAKEAFHHAPRSITRGSGWHRGPWAT